MLFRMAWRNLWRNKRRTLTAVAAVAGGVASMVIISALMNGMSDKMVEAVTGSWMGHAQIHHVGYGDNRSSALLIRDGERVLAAVRTTGGVAGAAGRLYGTAHASIVRGDDELIRSGGGQDVDAPVVILLGVEPAHETNVTDLDERIGG